MKLAICIPTRGIITSRTVQAVQAMMRFAEQYRPDLEILPEWYISHDRPIPHGHTYVVESALEDGADLVLLIEEDVIPPPHALEAMIKLLIKGADWAFVDYPLNVVARSGPNCYWRNEYGEVVYTGMGCTLITRQVWETVDRPWFRTDKAAKIKRGVLAFADQDVAYGGFDIYFGYKAFLHGFRLEVVPGMMCRHIKLAALGTPNSNDGLHVMEEKGRLNRG